MKIYVINEVAFEYNDEYYSSDGESGTPVKAYYSKTKAEDERDRLNERDFDPEMKDYEDKLIEDLYEVFSVEIERDPTESPFIHES